ncbi:DUF305 domain-containing protein [Streptomyces sp. NPDC101151]|uniref:DUF305 domain-containing protein n=1 Tax=Streptomyces sp. NPDC101151 TaxID=3366115 RepID=UPI0037FF00A6
MTTRTLTRRAALVAATGFASVVLAACGGSGAHPAHGTQASPSTPATADSTAHNAQDVAFAQGMIPHHQQALEMARLADGRAISARVKDLAARIEKGQDPEIRTMTGWLKAWGEQVPMAGMDHSGHAGMSGKAGMMSDGDMTALEKATGKDFDTKFLSLMVQHHRGAVETATTEKTKGRYGPAKGMADDIVGAQTAEIEEMNKLLGESGKTDS